MPVVLGTDSITISGTAQTAKFDTYLRDTVGTTNNLIGEPTVFTANIDIASVAAGNSYTIIVDTAGKVYAVGINGNGQLGLADTTQRTTPVPIPYFNTIPIASVSAGNLHTIFLDIYGKVYSVGANTNGQLGLGDSTQRTTPVPIPYFNTIPIKAVYAGTDCSIFLDTTGKVYAVGDGGSGRTGLNTGNISTPTPITYFNNIQISAVSGQNAHAIFLDTSGRVYATGNNTNGQLGLGSTTQQNTPVPIPFFNTIPIKSISTGNAQTIFLDTTGKVYSVGLNTFGRLGLGDLTQRTTPVLISYFNNISISAISTGGSHTIFLDTTGKVYSVGFNGNGRLGLGDTTDRDTPVQITYFNTIPISSIFAGSSFTILIDTTSKVYSVGANTNGQLGRGDTADISTPAPITYFTVTPTAVTATEDGTLANHKLFTLSAAGYYLLSFPAFTIVNINNGADIALNGTYKVIISSTRSSVLPVTSNLLTTIAFPQTLGVTNIVIRYHLRIPTRVPKQFVVETMKSVGGYPDPDGTGEPVVTNEFKIATFSHSNSNEAQTSYTINFPTPALCDILVVGGGGGGGKRHGGAGGAGALIYHKNVTLSGEYTIRVGKGGVGTTTNTGGQNPGDFSDIVKGGTTLYKAMGGGYGTSSGGVFASGGGSAGGQGYINTTLTLSTGNIFNGSSVAVVNNKYVNTLQIPEGCHGNLGGTQIENYKGGGGGGAGSVGQNHGLETTVNDGYGGLGLAIDITGTSVVYAGGGNGSDFNGGVSQVFDPLYPTIESRGGGGFGSDTGSAQNGLNGTGGGGGGQGNDGAFTSGSGGSGIVIIRYKLLPVVINNDFKYLALINNGINEYPTLSSDSTNLLVWYKFDDPNNLGKDEYNLRNLTNNGATSTIDLIRGSAYFNSNNQYLSIANFNLNFDTTVTTTGISFNLWFKLDNTSDYWAHLFCWGTHASTNKFALLRNDLTQKLVIQLGNTIQTPFDLSAYNHWTHIVVSINTSRVATIYENTVLRQTFTLTTSQYATMTTSSAFTIGTALGSNGIHDFKGGIDDFRIYNKVLTFAEIQQLYNIQTSYTVNFPVPRICDILVVGGGGGGGGGHGGGGGAGQLVFINNATLNGSYNIKVGRGGIRGTNPTSGGVEPTKGSDSSFDTVIAEGGGANGGTALINGGSGAGGDGWLSGIGTRGKGLKNTTVDTYSTGTVYSRGNDGGESLSVDDSASGQGGGGGGAGAPGGIGGRGNSNSSSGNGGDGLSGISEIGYDFKTNFGTNVGKLESDGLIYFAGGGGGGGWDISAPETNSIGGKGGGGAGGIGSGTSSGIAAVNNTGSGGGGGSANWGVGGDGGSGIVIIRYPRTKIPIDAQWTYSAANANVYYLGGNVGIGTTNPTNALHIVGDTFSTTYSGGSKNFKIEHPLKINKWLYHGCIEGPRFDNIYRGKKLIVDGKAEVDIDKECNTTGGMTSGTFPALNTNYQLYLQNNKTFDRVKGSISGSKIQIESLNVTDEFEVDWLVVGERHDQTVINPEFTDSDGNLICEHYYPGYNKYNSGEPAQPERIANIDVTEEYTVSQQGNTSNVIIEEELGNTNVTSNTNDTSNI